MNTTHPTVEELIGKDVVKRGNWTEERKEALKNLTEEEIWTDIMRQQAEHPERFNIKPVNVGTETVGA